MTRFRDIRKSVVKGTIMASGVAGIGTPQKPAKKDQVVLHEVATVQRISMWENGDRNTGRIRKGVRLETIVQPTHNRVSRRRAGNVKARKRLRGTIPPHPIKVINQAHRFQRACPHGIDEYIENDVMYCGACHLDLGTAVTA